MTAPVWGCPFHGLVKGSTLRLPNGQDIVGRFNAFAVPGSVLIQVPGVSAITRTPEEAAADAAKGYQWRTGAALVLGSSSAFQSVWGGVQFLGSHLYSRGPGQTWTVRLGITQSADGEYLEQPATLIPFGRFHEAYTEISVPVAIEGYTTDGPFAGMGIWDAAPDGSRAVFGWERFDDRFQCRMPIGPFAELQLSGGGELPLAAAFHRLSGYEEAASTTRTDGMTVFSGVWGWRFPASVSWVDSGQPCQWRHDTVTAGEVFLDAGGTPSIETPAVQIATGTRTGTITGFVLGYWYEEGEPVPVTLDLEYQLTSDFSVNGSATAITPQIWEQQYSGAGGASCSPNGSRYVIQTGEYHFLFDLHQQITETLAYVLRVGGVERDRRELRYELDRQLGMDSVGAVAFSTGDSGRPGTAAGVLEESYRLLVDGELVDGTGSTATGVAAELVASYGPSFGNLAIDTLNRFPTEPGLMPWLLRESEAVKKLPDEAPDTAHSWQCRAHWWSNHLVCLLEAFVELSGNRQRDRYGFTAYPGGVDAVVRDIPYPGAGRPAPLYGAHNPFDGAYVLGEPQPVVYI